VSGLSNPERAVRGLGALTLVLEAVVLLLALAPLRMLQHGIEPGQLAFILGGVVAAVLIAGLLRHRWAWWLGTGLQIALLLGGILHWTIAVIGIVFGLAWAYVIYVRRRVLS
jgi:Protein of unknown function (DUF4233)